MQPKPSLYDELYKYAIKPGILIVIDSDALCAPAIQGKKFIYDKDKNQLTISGKDLSQRDEADIIRLLNILQEEGVDILDSEQEGIIENYEGYSDSYNPYKDTIDLFAHKIPTKDYWALKMAYFIRIKNEEGKDIKEYRQQIRERFGLRGLYISNLCVAGYYEGIFRTNVMKLNSSKFKEYYELKVGFELAAIFVHNGLTKKSLRLILTEKVSLCSQNGIFKFKIHAMGGENVDLVKELINSNIAGELGIQFNVVSETSNRHPVFIDVEIEIL